MSVTVTAAAHPNLALVKYWGQVDEALNLPANDSISVNLNGATTTTSVSFEEALAADRISINNIPADPVAYTRVSTHLDRVRTLANITTPARVISHNDFPASAGIASSASAFAALTLAATRAAGLALDKRQISVLARKGSGSACRSIPDGFVQWVAGQDDAGAYAYTLAPCEHWELHITTVYFGNHVKTVSSLEGHHAAESSPFYKARLTEIPHTLETVRMALLNRDITTLGLAVEREAISLHTIAMTSSLVDRPWLSGIYYWQPATLRLIKTVQTWRREGLPVYFTLDAGASVHLICERDDHPTLTKLLAPLLVELGGASIVSIPGRGAWQTNNAGQVPPPEDTTYPTP